MLEVSLIEDEGGGTSLPVGGAEVDAFVSADVFLVFVAIVPETEGCGCDAAVAG